MPEGEQATDGAREPSWVTKKIEDSPKGRKPLLRHPTKAETNYFRDFIDENQGLRLEKRKQTERRRSYA